MKILRPVAVAVVPQVVPAAAPPKTQSHVYQAHRADCLRLFSRLFVFSHLGFLIDVAALMNLKLRTWLFPLLILSLVLTLGCGSSGKGVNKDKDRPRRPKDKNVNKDAW